MTDLIGILIVIALYLQACLIWRDADADAR